MSLRLCILILFSIVPLDNLSQSFAGKEVYLIDSLVIEELSKRDFKLLDSVLQVYHTKKHDTCRVKALSYICEEMTHQAWFKYQLFQLNIINKALKSKITSSERDFFMKHKSMSFNNISIFHHLNGNIPLSLEYAKKSLTLEKKLNNKDNMAEILNTIAALYYRQGKVSKSLYYFQQSINLRIKTKNIKGIAHTLNNIGIICSQQGNQNLALKYYLQSLKSYRTAKSKKGIATVLSNIAQNFHYRKNYKMTISIYRRCLEISSEIGANSQRAVVLNNLGYLYNELRNYNKALEYLNESLELGEKEGSKKIISDALINIAKILLDQGKPEMSSPLIERSLKLAKEIGFTKNIRDATKILSMVYQELGDYEQALKNHQLHISMKDSMVNMETQRAITKLENKHKLKRKENKILLLTKEKQLKKRQLIITLLASVTLLILFVSVGIVLYQKKKMRYEGELSTLRKMKFESTQENNIEKLTSIPVTLGKKLMIIDPEDISFFDTHNRYVLLNTKEGRSYVVDYSISSLEKVLPSNFIRVHRSFIININDIKEITRTYNKKVVFTLKGKSTKKIPSSIGFSDRIKSIIEDFKPN